MHIKNPVGDFSPTGFVEQPKKIFRPIIVATMLLGLVSQQVYAIDTTAINEKWGKPTVVYGGG